MVQETKPLLLSDQRTIVVVAGIFQTGIKRKGFLERKRPSHRSRAIVLTPSPDLLPQYLIDGFYCRKDQNAVTFEDLISVSLSKSHLRSSSVACPSI